jgi:hypothetical protein
MFIKGYGPDPHGVGIPSTRIYHQARLNNNIPTQLDTIGPYRTEYLSVFDQKNNPVYASVPVHYMVYDPVNYIFDNTNKNTVTDMSWKRKDIVGGSTVQAHYKYVYQYDKNEQPIVAREYDLVTGSSLYIKYVFKYN